MLRADPLHAFTETVLAYRMERPTAPEPPQALSPDERQRHVARTLRLLERSGKRGVLLLGLGGGELAADLAASLPPGVALTVCETDPQVARNVRDAGLLGWRRPDGPHQLLVEQSPWAHLCLLFGRSTAPPDCATLLNPEVRDPAVRNELQKLQRFLLGTREATIPAPDPHSDTAAAALPEDRRGCGQAVPNTREPNAATADRPSSAPPDLTVAAIVSPGESELGRWVSRFPAWVREVVLVWDAPEIPKSSGAEIACAAPLIQLARLLDDFAAQRNAMLAACSGSWILSLDADEDLAPNTWERLRALLTRPTALTHVHFPRATFHPDEDHCRAGYGLWPDLQLRLFRRDANLRYVHPVHERLDGLRGPGAILPDDPILHFSHLRKRPDELQTKLERFDRASGGAIRHRLTADYPHLPLALLHPPPSPGAPPRLLRLPD